MNCDTILCLLPRYYYHGNLWVIMLIFFPHFVLNHSLVLHWPLLTDDMEKNLCVLFFFRFSLTQNPILRYIIDKLAHLHTWRVGASECEKVAMNLKGLNVCKRGKAAQNAVRCLPRKCAPNASDINIQFTTALAHYSNWPNCVRKLCCLCFQYHVVHLHLVLGHMQNCSIHLTCSTSHISIQLFSSAYAWDI